MLQRAPCSTHATFGIEPARTAEAGELALRKLLLLARPAEARSLALLHTWVARHEAGMPQRRSQRLVGVHQCPRDAVPHGLGLARLAAAAHLHEDIEGVRHAGNL